MGMYGDPYISKKTWDSERQLVIVLYANQKLFVSEYVSQRPFFGNFVIVMDNVDFMKEIYKFSCKKKREMALAFFFVFCDSKIEKIKTDPYGISFKKSEKLEII
jgi:hypothetical protein